MKSWRALKLRKGRNLLATLNRFVGKRCIAGHGIKANGRNKKFKQCRSPSLYYCSKKCQKRHWKHVHAFESCKNTVYN